MYSYPRPCYIIFDGDEPDEIAMTLEDAIKYWPQESLRRPTDGELKVYLASLNHKDENNVKTNRNASSSLSMVSPESVEDDIGVRKISEGCYEVYCKFEGLVRYFGETKTEDEAFELFDHASSMIHCSHKTEADSRAFRPRKTNRPRDGSGNEAGPNAADQTSTSTSGGKRKKGRGHPKDAKRVMIEWMVSDEHIRHPIPDQKELEMLALATGLQEKQIKSWIYSNRKRWWEPEVLKRGGEVDGFKSVWPEDSSFGDSLPCLRPLHPFPFRRFCLLLSIFSISLAPISPQALFLRSSTLLLSFPPPPCVPYFHHYHASLSRPSVSSSPTSSRSLPRLFLPLYVFALP